MIELEVDTYLAKVAHDHNWTDYFITADANIAPPIPSDPGIKKNMGVRAALVGIKTLAEMVGSEGPVEKPSAENRAAICVVCPKHEKGTWESLFTIPAARAARKIIGIVHGASLTTSNDENLRVCGACGCPCLAKVWARIEHIQKHMDDETKAALAPGCWIVAESK